MTSDTYATGLENVRPGDLASTLRTPDIPTTYSKTPGEIDAMLASGATRAC